MGKKKVMVVDDDEKSVIEVAAMLEAEGYTAAAFSSAAAAIQTLEAVCDLDLILTDIHMPGMDGTEVLKAAQRLRRPVPVVVFTGFGDVDTAVNIMKAGASDFLCKPISKKELAVRIKKVIEKDELASEVAQLRKRLEDAEAFHSLVGKSRRMQEVYELIAALAQTDATALVRGETGTGKELAARAIHASSARKDEPFVAISCTAIQHTLLESELFGHEKGAFTGAHAQKTGKLEFAGQGTVLLDEIGDTSLEIQAKLLRVLQEKEFERVGGMKPIQLNARIIAATNRNLEEAVAGGKFREDLYYRLNVVQVDLPPLREREEDVMLLANHFLDVFRKRHQKTIEGFTPAAIEQMHEYAWPGNVRELQNAIERTVITNPRRWIDRIARIEAVKANTNPYAGLPGRLSYVKAREEMVRELDKTYLMHYMKQERGQISRVAELMGVSTRTVSRLLERWGLDKMFFKKQGE
ncbi:MAG: sigma-54-dependent Fis family transcriptional regulator [Deltaproteobacteria bacterium]|nr:sigma-54-dependent Fis family transcriptional regulator [Deltaproteobacteria bacterium]